MGVPRDDQPGPIGHHGVQDALVGRMHQADGEGGILGGGTGDRGIPVELNMRVVHPHELQRKPCHVYSAPLVVQIQPTALAQAIHEGLSWQHGPLALHLRVA